MAPIATAVLFLIIFAMFVAHGTSVDTLNIFLLGGQSNMVGRGGLGDPGAELVPSPSILRFSGNDTWEQAADPLHCDIDTSPGKYCGVGPGMSFAKTLLKSDPNLGLVGLVPCAMGDTSITEWSKDSCLYNRMLARANGAVRAGGGVIRALLWYQGEKDSKVAQDALMYKAKFQKFVADVRYDLEMPLLPVIEVALDFENNGTYTIDLVRKAQNETAAELQQVKCVDAKGLEISFDHVHLTTASQVKLGAMMAEAFLNSFN